MRVQTKFFVTTLVTIHCLIVVTHFFKESNTVTQAQIKESIPLIKLETTELLFNQLNSKAINTSSSDEQSLYSLENGTGNLLTRNQESRVSKKLFEGMLDADLFAVSKDKKIYAANLVSGVKIIDSTGKVQNTISLPRPTALAPLENGNLLVASTAKKKLFNLYNAKGVWLDSFGELKKIDKNTAQNDFLNKGKFVVTPSSDIYYVYTFSPIPTIQRFSSDGQLLLEFPIEGEAINIQLEKAKEFLDARKPSQIGGIRIINSIAFDSATNHIFIAMNGSAHRNQVTSSSGVIYEYDLNGKKLNEYALVSYAESNLPKVIIDVKDIAIKSSSLYVLTTEGKIFRFTLPNTKLDVMKLIPPFSSC
jgi:hypothetical protein